MTDQVVAEDEAARIRAAFAATATKVGQQLQYQMLLSRFNAQLRNGSHLDAGISTLVALGEVSQTKPGGPIKRLK